MMFNIETREELARHLAVHPVEVERVIADRRKYYHPFKKIKPDGSFRVIYNVQDPLKLLQQKIKQYILDLVPMLDCVHGGVRFRSLLTNARPHIAKDIVLCLDIKNFFPSVRPHLVRTIFKALGFRPESAEILTDATTWDNQLPQGCSTSNGLANLSMWRVDTRLQGLARQHGFAYTRWSDDLTLSGNRRLLDFTNLIQKIVREEGFSVNVEKMRTMHSGMRQLVTGVVVNKKLNVAREQREAIRRGVFQFRSPRRFEDESLDTLRGKLSWISQVNPVLGARLSNRLETRGGSAAK